MRRIALASSAELSPLGAHEDQVFGACREINVALFSERSLFLAFAPDAVDRLASAVLRRLN